MTTLYERTMSSFPISIGTALALESLFVGRQEPYDSSRKIPNKVNVADYQICLFNLETLLRNIESASQKSSFLEATPSHILEILLGEIEIIQSLFQNEGHGLCQPVFYYCTYKKLQHDHHKSVQFREANTTLQKSYDFKIQKVLHLLSKQTDQVYVFDSEIKLPIPNAHKPIALMMTHYPYDLTSENHFKTLDFLESHTGVLKTKSQWNTKYHPMGSNDLSHLPFHRSLLLIFGDRNLIHPSAFKVRQRVLDISVKDKWTPFTKLHEIEQSYKKHIDHPADLAFLLSFSH